MYLNFVRGGSSFVEDSQLYQIKIVLKDKMMICFYGIKFEIKSRLASDNLISICSFSELFSGVFCTCQPKCGF